MAVDADADGQPDAGATPLKVYGALARGIHIVSGALRTRLLFSPDGSAPGGNSLRTLYHARAGTRMFEYIEVD